MPRTIDSGDEYVAPSGEERFADGINIGGQLTIAGQLNLSGALSVSADGIGEGTGAATPFFIRRIIRRENVGLDYNTTEEFDLNAERDS